jgi:hypothetical protein
LGSNIIEIIKRNSEEPSTQEAVNSLSIGPIKSEKAAVKEWAQCLLMEPTLCHLFTNKEGNSSFPSLHAYKEQLVFFLEPFLAVPTQPAHHGPSSHRKLWILILFIW